MLRFDTKKIQIQVAGFASDCFTQKMFNFAKYVQ